MRTKKQLRDEREAKEKHACSDDADNKFDEAKFVKTRLMEELSGGTWLSTNLTVT